MRCEFGHEAVGTVETVGSGVKTVKPDDRVLVSCITACGRCRFCREGRYGQCLGGAPVQPRPRHRDRPGELAVRLARPGGRIANIGVHGEPATPHLEEQWIRDITIRTGLVDTSSTPTLLRLVTGHQIDAGRFVTHRFPLDDFVDAYAVFADAGHTGALKVVLTR